MNKENKWMKEHTWVLGLSSKLHIRYFYTWIQKGCGRILAT